MKIAAKTVREWGHLPIGGSGLPKTAASRLHALAERETRRLHVPQPVLTRTSKPSLRAGQVVGILTVPGACVEILPKIADEEDGNVRRALTRMLAVAWGLPIADSEPALLLSQRHNLLEVLVRLFVDRLIAAIRRGMPHRYLLREEDLPLLRGKLDIRSQFTRNAVRPNRLACRYDELSVDTPLNRVFKAAVARLALATRSAANARRLAELAARFEFVSNSTDPLREKVRLDRTNTAFHQLHSLARMFLIGDWQTTTIGRMEGFALLFPMNDLFEVYVGRTMQAALAPRMVSLQDTGHHALEEHGRGGLFRLQPDIVVDGDIVIDTKWKSLTRGETTCGVSQSDVYQMLAYQRAYNARRLMLVYPCQQGFESPGIHPSWRVNNTSTPFEICTVDIAKLETVGSTLRETIGNDTSLGNVQGNPALASGH